MPKLIQKQLTVKQVKAETRRGLHADGNGLYLCVEGGSRSWKFRYMLNGTAYVLGLGPVRFVSLEDARQRALELQRQIRRGENPMTLRRKIAAQKAKAVTFRQVAE